MTFAQKLRELREAKGLSEAKLAEVSGLTFSAVHQYGLGRRNPSFAAAVKLAHALGVTCEAFADCVDMDAEGEEALSRVQGKPSRGKPAKAKVGIKETKSEPPGDRPRKGKPSGEKGKGKGRGKKA